MQDTPDVPPNAAQRLAELIRDVPDFPKPGIVYKDITPLLAHKRGLSMALDLMTQKHVDRAVDVVAGIESRGFIFGAALAARLEASFVPLRKAGKLPAACLREEYELEYGTAILEVHADALEAGSRVLICDDLIATGGSAAAATRLIQRLGGELIGYSFVIELGFLDGREKLADVETSALIRYD